MSTRENAPAGDLPELLDVLIVGGGPGGTATAFAAVEQGLSVLVIDIDDLMRRIRDYSKDKLILPSFGGGDRMGFPEGGELVSALRFPPIDKDEMCARWKALYREHRVPARTGIELTGLERRDDGTWRALAWDHRERCDAELSARTVVLALGRGVPRRFDIPGDTEGIAFRLGDPAAYIGSPACVVGGGTSAAEAVIAMSNAKAAAGDPTAVYWSYRGDRMPRVSRALAEVFFTAYVGNGNIRYYPRSEPVAVVTADDHSQHLAVRVDRRVLDGRPSETTHLEFPKACCLACIGEDIPEPLLDTLGLPMVTGGPRGKKRLLVNRYLESRQPGVYVVGDLLSQAYFESDDFDADPAGFREVKHRGNIKAALRDAVLVAQVIRQRLDGRQEIEVQVEDAEEPEPRTMAGAGAGAGADDADGPPAASLDRDRRVELAEAFLTRLLPGGVDGEEYPLRRDAVTTIGRRGCDAAFADDTALSPQHASIAHTEDGYLLRDDGSATGVFLELRPAVMREVRPGDLVRCGRQLLRFFADGGEPGFTHFDVAGRELGRHELPERTIVVGRRAPDVTLDADDRTLSRRQLAITVDRGRVLIKDLKSVNGTLLRVRDAVRLEHGDRFRAGQQRFLFSVGDDAALSPGHRAAPEPAPKPAPGSAPEPAAAAPPATGAPAPSVAAGEAAAGGPSVVFRGLGRRVEVAPGQTLCEAAEAAGIPITAECHAGICGSDPVRILAGHEHLAAAADEQECETLEMICEREPGEHRLACKLRVTGPVEVEIL